MTPPNPIELQKSILGELDPTVLSLGVPLAHGALQVGAFTRTGEPMSRLGAIVAEGFISLNREDGQALQIDDNERLASSATVSRVRLLESPVSGGLTLRGSSASPGIWHAEGEGLVIADIARFDRFLTQFFIHAYRKQNPDIGAAGLLELLDKYQEF
jgi:hypothetical protein